MWKYILYGILIWFLYNLVFRLIIPVYKASRQMKEKFREMQTRMQEQAARQGGYTPPQSATVNKTASTQSSDDYIDFEEIK